jgi:hypothetical protein
MINFNKIQLPNLHVNPINRDLFLVIILALAVAFTLVFATGMIISQI